MSIIGIIGSRRRNSKADFEAVEVAFRKIYQPGDRIVSGGCPQGGDRFAEIIAIMLARPGHWSPLGPPWDIEIVLGWSLMERHHLIKDLGAPFILHPARWDQIGRSAGFKRNGLIARDADILIACVSADRTGGTEDSIRKYLALGKTDLIVV